MILVIADNSIQGLSASLPRFRCQDSIWAQLIQVPEVVSLVIKAPSIEQDAEGEDGVVLVVGHDVQGDWLTCYGMLVIDRIEIDRFKLQGNFIIRIVSRIVCGMFCFGKT